VVVLSAFAGWLALGAWRRGERVKAIGRFGWAIAPWAAWLLGMFTLGWRVGDAFGDWGQRFVFNPAAWLGLIGAGVSVALIWVGLRFGSGGEEGEAESPRRRRRAVESGSGSSGSGEFDDIEAILKKRGIT
jgi:hypothetical protein